MADFKLQSSYSPSGDQPNAIDALVSGIRNNDKEQVLLGITGWTNQGSKKIKEKSKTNTWDR